MKSAREIELEARVAALEMKLVQAAPSSSRQALNAEANVDARTKGEQQP